MNYFSDDIVHRLTIGLCHLKFAVYNKTWLDNSAGGLPQNVIHQPKRKRYCIDLLPFVIKFLRFYLDTLNHFQVLTLL